ncbi:MAG: PPOX class F420-dependent oxidoreductase [Blastocatellia bacterium AA13]|nr:MAG: PPOX class F420-dependent oxidoreductase [Blastocatellia bacterium AA13]
MAGIPEKYRDILEKKSFAHLCTLMPDGSPQSTPVWCDYDGTHIIINSARGRRKDKNMKRNSRVALSLLDPDNPYRYLEIRGEVVDITEEGGDEHIDKMAQKYLGKDRYPWRRPDEVRVLYKIRPDHTTSMG